MNISHIVFAGCSFTYCQNLDLQKSWPKLIASYFNTNLVNLAVPGVGNDNIHRRLYEYVYKNSVIPNSHPLVVVSFSDPWRREVWSKQHYLSDDFEDYAPVSYPNDKPETYYEYALLENWNEEDFIRKSLISKLSLINLFHSFNIPYIFTDSFLQYNDEIAYNKVRCKFQPLIDLVHNQFYINSIFEIAKTCKNLPCGHYGEEACQDISSEIIDSINKLYPNLKFKNNIEHLLLSDFIKLDKYHRKFPDWCTFDYKPAILP